MRMLALTLALGLPILASTPAADWHYELMLRGQQVEVQAQLPPGSGRGLVIKGAEPADRARLAALDCTEGCAFSYRISLAPGGPAGAGVRHHGRVAMVRPGALLARPQETPDGAIAELGLFAEPGQRLLSGLPTVAGQWRGPAAQLESLPLLAMGPLELVRLDIDGTPLSLAFETGRFEAPPPALGAWAEAHARAVARYFGRFPASQALILALPSEGQAVGFGVVQGGGGAMIRMYVGRRARADDFAGDWKLRHELSHLGLPNLHARHRWLEEGLATYVETLLGAKIGQTTPPELWAQLYEGFSQGLPRGDGFEGTRRWGEVYWGGALFWFMADLQVRRNTQGARTLADVLRATVAAGGTMLTTWSIERWLKVADAAVPEAKLGPLYTQFAARGTPVDLEAMWARLGVRGRTLSTLEFDPGAPEAELRESLGRPF